MPLNKSTTYHQSVQFFVQFFSKKNLSFYLVKKEFRNFFRKIFLLSFTSNLLSFTTFYSVLPRLVLSFTEYPKHDLHPKSAGSSGLLSFTAFLPFPQSPSGLQHV